MGPAVIGAAAVQVNVLINSRFATNIPGEAVPVSWLNYSFRLMQFPIGVFGRRNPTPRCCDLSYAALRDINRVSSHSRWFDSIWHFLLTIPSAVGTDHSGASNHSEIYEHGNVFGRYDTNHTAAALAFYAIGLAGYAAVRISPRHFTLSNDQERHDDKPTLDGNELRYELDAGWACFRNGGLAVDFDGSTDELALCTQSCIAA